MGDNETKDFIAPNRMGMLTIQVLREHRLHTEQGAETDAKATLQTSRIEDLASLLVRY